MDKTFGSILRPTKGSDSYAQLAQRANNWLRKQSEQGRRLEVFRMSAEQVRRIFEDQTASPKPIYLEALGSVQGVDINELYEAAGYPVAPRVDASKTPHDKMKALVYELRGGKKTPATDAEMRQILEDILAEEALEHINGEPEL